MGIPLAKWLPLLRHLYNRAHDPSSAEWVTEESTRPFPIYPLTIGFRLPMPLLRPEAEPVPLPVGLRRGKWTPEFTMKVLPSLCRMCNQPIKYGACSPCKMYYCGPREYGLDLDIPGQNFHIRYGQDRGTWLYGLAKGPEALSTGYLAPQDALNHPRVQILMAFS